MDGEVAAAAVPAEIGSEAESEADGVDPTTTAAAATTTAAVDPENAASTVADPAPLPSFDDDADADADAIGDISDDDDDDADVVGDISDDDADDTATASASAVAPKTASSADLSKVRQDPKNRTTQGVFESDDEDGGAADTGVDASQGFEEEEEAEDIEYTKELPMPARHFGDDVALLKMPNFLSIEPVPFHPETYEEVRADDVTGKLDELGRNRVKLSVDNTLRWRYSADDQGNYIVGDDGEYAKESNAKLVKWSDGSETLVLGESHIGVVRKDISTEVNCLLLQHDEQNLEALGLMNSKVSLKPMSANSKFHQRLTKTAAVAVEKKLKKMTSLKGATLDPNLQKQELDRTHSARINASRRREEKQYAEREKHARGAPMSRDFLEEGIADDDAGYMQTAYSDDEAVESEEEEPEKPQARSSQRHRIDDDEDEEEDGEVDEATTAAADAAAEVRKRRKIEDSDEED
eukprot:m.45990 g.45990  ORF g.45990 m.45990 type:complete len:466 (+) comp15318_c0_seq2:289-1686(+)